MTLNQADLSPALLKLLFLSSVTFRCCKEVKDLSNRYLFYAESGIHSTAMYVSFFFHLGAVILGSS